MMDIAEKMAADIALDMNGGEWTDGKWYSQGHRDAWIKAVKPYADEIERLQKENELLQKEVKKHLTYQDHRHGRIGTHDPICYEYGPRHYECALREIDSLREKVDELKDLMQATVNYTGASVSSTNYTFHAALKEGE